MRTGIIAGIVCAGMVSVGAARGPMDEAPEPPILSAPVKPSAVEWARRVHYRSETPTHMRGVERAAIPLSRGSNLTVEGIRLASDVTVERGFRVESRVSNTGGEILYNIGLDFFLGHPDSGGTSLCDDFSIPEISPGETRVDSITWGGMTGSGRIFCVVDYDDMIPEDDETDNMLSLGLSVRDDVPWVWQIVNGYCNYASLTMIFNWAGADHTVYETVEFASCPHSVVYIDDCYYLPGGVLISQSQSDYEFAGDLRAMDTDLKIAQTWEQYLVFLHESIDSGIPFMTSVDPFYLPEMDYSDLWEYGLHGGHAVVVTGYTDSSVIINDPGVGLGLISDPIPHPELRGADVVVDLNVFRNAVEFTQGTPRILVSYESAGVMPAENTMFAVALRQSISRLEGDAQSYDDAWIDYWPSGWYPSFGINGLQTAALDMNMETFGIAFDELMEEENNDLEAALLTLASFLGDGLFWTQIGWEASEEYYETMEDEDAGSLVLVSRALSQQAESAYLTVLDIIMAIWDSGGNVNLAAPYLEQLKTDFNSMTQLEETALGLLKDILVTGPGEYPLPESAVTGSLTCSPNPSESVVYIRATGLETDTNELAVYDITGHRIQILKSPHIDGIQRLYSWDGRDAFGRRLPGGTYLLESSNGSSARVVILN